MNTWAGSAAGERLSDHRPRGINRINLLCYGMYNRPLSIFSFMPYERIVFLRLTFSNCRRLRGPFGGFGENCSQKSLWCTR